MNFTIGLKLLLVPRQALQDKTNERWHTMVMSVAIEKLLVHHTSANPPDIPKMPKMPALSPLFASEHHCGAARAACHVRLRCYARLPRASACWASSARLADSMIMMCQLAHHQAARGCGLVDAIAAGEVCTVRWDAHGVPEVTP